MGCIVRRPIVSQSSGFQRTGALLIAAIMAHLGGVTSLHPSFPSPSPTSFVRHEHCVTLARNIFVVQREKRFPRRALRAVGIKSAVSVIMAVLMDVINQQTALLCPLTVQLSDAPRPVDWEGKFTILDPCWWHTSYIENELVFYATTVTLIIILDTVRGKSNRPPFFCTSVGHFPLQCMLNGRPLLVCRYTDYVSQTIVTFLTERTLWPLHIVILRHYQCLEICKHFCYSTSTTFNQFSSLLYKQDGESSCCPVESLQK